MFVSFFVYESKTQVANIFWVYDDRTCFSMNKYLDDAREYEKLRRHILIRNRILALIYCVCSLLFVLAGKFQEYKDLYQQVLNFKFVPETERFFPAI